MRLNVDVRGDGPVVVLLHGFPLNRTLWSSQLEELSAGYRVITPDLRGFGESVASIRAGSLEDLADDVIETLDQLQINAAIALGGLSMGGYVALAIAERYPERLRGLILLNSRAVADTPEIVEKRKASANQIESDQSTSSLIGMAKQLIAPTNQKRPELVERVASMIRSTTAIGAANAQRAMAMRPDRRALLEKLPVPILVVAGDSDPIVPIEESQAMAAAAPDGMLIEVTNAGHLVPIEAPAATSAALRDFLGRLT